jgi:hypothetical protein
MIGILVEDLVKKPIERAVVDDGQHAKRAVVQLVGNVPREVSQAPIEVGRPHLSGRLFSPDLHPVLDSGERDKDAVVAPQMPTGGLIGQAVLDDESHGQGDDAMDIMGLRHGVVGHVCVDVFAAAGAAMLGIHKVNVARAPGNQVSHVVMDSCASTAAETRLATGRPMPMAEFAAAMNDFGFRQIFGSLALFIFAARVRFRPGETGALSRTPVYPVDGSTAVGGTKAAGHSGGCHQTRAARHARQPPSRSTLTPQRSLPEVSLQARKDRYPTVQHVRLALAGLIGKSAPEFLPITW